MTQVFSGTAGQVLTAGSSVITSPAQFDKTKLLATTEFVQRALGNFQASGVLQTNYQLLPTDAGKTLSWDGAAGLIATLPPLATVPDGATYYLFGAAVGGIIKAAAGENIFAGTSGNQSQLTVRIASSIQVTKSGTIWLMSGGSMIVVASAEFAASIATNGWQRLPSGLILQWGLTASGGGIVSTTFPVAFPTACIKVLENDQVGSTAYPTSKTLWQIGLVNRFAFDGLNMGRFYTASAGAVPTILAGQPASLSYLAIGY